MFNDKINDADAQALFDFSVENYRKACDYISEMAEFALKVDPSFSVKSALIQFDLLLQAVLYRQAITDGEVSGIELEYIVKITDHADLMDYLQKKDPEYGELYSWDIAASFPKRKLKKMADIIEQELSSIGYDFSTTFGIIDAFTDFDCISALIDCMGAISVSFSHMDGKASSKEITAAAKAATDLIAAYFLNAKAKTIEEI